MQTYATSESKKASTAVFANKSKQQSFFSPVMVQPRLSIGPANDPLEREADEMSEKVMRMKGPSTDQKTFFKPAPDSVPRKCAHCEEEDKKLQRKEGNGEPITAGSSLEHYVGTLSGGGEFLSPEIRSFYEPRFGYDFSNVKVHTNDGAAKSAQSINALAYTWQNNIIFNQGQYSPQTESGKKLLGHELTHVIQQGQGISSKIQCLGDLSKVPPMSCDVANSSSTGLPGDSFLFTTSSSSLTADQRKDVAIFAESWKAGGAKDTIRVDGFASKSGTDELNWRLSCDRALSVASELRNNGVPDAMITIFAQGETSEFGAEVNNQRAEITVIAAPVPPSITSETVLTSPGSRARTSIGVGEDVKLTHSLGTAGTTWVTTGGTLSSNKGASVVLTAPDTKQNVTVSADGATITFRIIAPNDVRMVKATNTIKHTLNKPDSGVLVDVFLLPDNVNFRNVTYRELDVVGVPNAGAGAYSCNTFKGGHCSPAGLAPCGDKSLTATVEAGRGTKSVLGDCAYSGHCGGSPPFSPGFIIVVIPYEYKVGAGTFRKFATVIQIHILSSDKSTLFTSKAGATGSITVSSPTALIASCP
jgi:outer membrane protein OmpA-like peptidoglycan-associated protein